jgi:hypothetical protein
MTYIGETQKRGIPRKSTEEVFMADLIADSPENRWLTRKQLSNREQVPEATLAQWASGSERRGPKFAKFGRHVRYRLSDVIAWENAQFSDDPVDIPELDSTVEEEETSA